MLIWLSDRVSEYEDSGAGAVAAHFEFKDWMPHANDLLSHCLDIFSHDIF